MKINIKYLMNILLISGIATGAQAAAPTMDSFHVQSFLKLSNNSAVSATSADFVFAIFKGTSCIWAKRYSSVAINSGVLNQKLSGTGTNVTSINNASATPGECVDNFSGTAINGTLLNTGSPAALSIRIYTETSIDSYKPIWDIPLNSAPTAFIADTATTATTANDLAANIKTDVSSGAPDAGKFAVLNSSGLIDDSMINTSGFTISNTQVSGLGTASTVNTGTMMGTIPVLGAGGKLNATMMPSYSANKIMASDGTGLMNATYDTTNTSIGASDSGKVPLLNGSGKIDNSMVEADPTNFTGVVPVTKGGTGLATITTNGLMVGAGTGNVTTLAPGTAGNILYSNGTTWLSGTRDAAGVVDKVNAQTGIAGAKTFTGAITHSSTTVMTGAITANGATTFGSSMKVGTTNGTAYTQMKTCQIPSAAMATGNNRTVACAGVTTAAIVHCTPTVAPPAPSAGNAWVIIPYVSAAGTIAINVTEIGTGPAWTTAFNCKATQ